MAEDIRICRGCGETKPGDGYYRNHTICRVCEAIRSRERFATLSNEEKERHRQYHRDYHSSHPASQERRQRLADNQRARAAVRHQAKSPKVPIDTSGITSKKCKGCGGVKDLEFFLKHKAGHLGRVARCSPCLNKQRRERGAANPELIEKRKARDKAYRENLSPEKREHKRRVMREWTAGRVVSEEQRKRNLESGKRWRERNPLKTMENVRRRAARLKNARIEKVSYRRVLERDGMHCYLCGGDVTKETLSFDHVIPLSKRGEHSEMNLKVAHRRCNSRKNDTQLWELGPWAWTPMEVAA